MVQVTAATFADGVLKPDDTLNLSPNTRVRLLVETLEDNAEESCRHQAWQALEQIWRQSTLDSQGDRLSRDQLHERR